LKARAVTNPEPADKTTNRSPDAAGHELLSRRISDLELTIKGTRLEALLAQLYRELEIGGLLYFKPEAYLSDEWGCPAGVPVIGIPFYLANPELCVLECKLTGIEAETDDEVMMYLRHEAGHAFNYAHKLYKRVGWTRIFGDYSMPYRETYGVVPFSSRYVRHIPGWYAQKHPDDDFAESFAVWLTPGSNWREVYAGTPALKKLLYIDKAARHYCLKPVKVKKRALDTPVEDITMTLDSWYRTYGEHDHEPITTHRILDEDLRRAFPAVSGEPAAGILDTCRVRLVFETNKWTGLERHILGALFDDLLGKVRALDLKIEPDLKAARLESFAIVVTTLAMNFLNRGKFVE
jgi:hypothetical protein